MKKLIGKVVGMISTFGIVASTCTVNVFADGASYDDEVLQKMSEQTDAGVFQELSNSIQEIGGGLFNLGQTSGKVVLVISIILCGLGWMLFRSPMRKDENKSALVNTFIGAFFVFGVLGIVATVLSIVG